MKIFSSDKWVKFMKKQQNFYFRKLNRKKEYKMQRIKIQLKLREFFLFKDNIYISNCSFKIKFKFYALSTKSKLFR